MDAPANGSTILVPVLASQLDRNHPGDTIDYEVFGDNFVGEASETDFLDEVSPGGVAVRVRPGGRQGDFFGLDPGPAGPLGLTVDEAAVRRPSDQGLEVVTLDDMNGAAQADLVPVGDLPRAPSSGHTLEAPGTAGGFVMPGGIVRWRRAAGSRAR